MENTERSKFEKNWKEAFEGQEMEPSISVWNNIDLKLDNDKMKRRVIFYQRLAAASVFFALLVGIGGTQFYNRNQASDVASVSKTEPNQEQKIASREMKEQSLRIENENEENVKEEEANQEQLHTEIVISKATDQLPSSSLPKNKQEGIEATISSSGVDSRKQNSVAGNEKNINQHDLQTATSETVSATKGNRKVLNNKNEFLKESMNTYDYSVTNGNDSQIASLSKSEDREELVKSNKIETGNGSVPMPMSQANQTKQDLFRKILSSNSVYNKMTAYLSPQLKNKELPKEALLMKEDKSELPEMPASMMTTASSNKKSEENSWLSFGAAAGSYNPGNSSSSIAASSALIQNSTSSFVNSAATQTNTRSSIGSAYSVGLSFGKKVASRLILQTGVNYMSQAISYTSSYTSYTASNERTAFVADYADKSSAPLAISQPYEVISNMEFVSVPMQAGYLFIDRKFGLQWNAGVGTDIFLRNTLKDQSGQSNKYSQGSGNKSPYRSLNIAALTSTELSYKIGTQYRLSLVPGVRYSFQSALKSQSAIGSNPLVLDIGFRFRYIFH